MTPRHLVLRDFPRGRTRQDVGIDGPGSPFTGGGPVLDPVLTPIRVRLVLPLGPLGFERAQHRRTPRPSVDGTRSKALCLRTRHTLEPLAWHWSQWPGQSVNWRTRPAPWLVAVVFPNLLTHPPSLRQGYLAHNKTPTPLGPPQDPKHRPAGGS